jgi:hypothetical protein
MISVANRWQSEIRKPADGTQPVSTGFGTTITADPSTLHTKGAWTDVIVAADWSGFTGDSFEIEIRFDSGSVSASNIQILADIGVDSGGGYASIIDNLQATEASPWQTASLGLIYKFPLRIANGVKIGCRIQSNTLSQTVRVGIIVRGNPSNPALVRAGTFVRTFGAVTASSSGTAITPGTVAEGAWTQITAATADDLWFWDAGYGNADNTNNSGGMVVDLATGAAAAEVGFAFNIAFGKSTTEALGKVAAGVVWPVASGARISARMQVTTSETSETLIIYAVGGSHALATPYTVAGTITINGAAAANGKNVQIFAIDSDGISELVTTVTTGGGTGAFSASVPDNTRSYFASYNNDGNYGRSALGTPV